jgi:uncharacterized Zn finger protein
MQEIIIDHKCTSCFPEEKTENGYNQGWTFQNIIIGKRKTNKQIRCEKCGQLLGNIIIK